jgi:hypothetical protein
MAGSDIQTGTGDANLPINKLPAAALQAIYHAVTGKTESLTKSFDGNVLIERDDIDNLYWMLQEQLNHYTRVCEPTTTIVVKYEDQKAVTYSSWERFQALQVHHLDVVSDIVVKIELVLRLPETGVDQRLIINVLLDSSLPVIKGQDDQSTLIPWYIYGGRKWKSVSITIDFVDFLIARLFTGIVREWFDKLKAAPRSAANDFLFDKYGHIDTAISQFGRIGMATFLASYIFFSDRAELDFASITYAVSIASVIWAVFTMFGSSVTTAFLKRLINNFVPTVILLTEGDRRAYDDVIRRRASPLRWAAFVAMTAIFNIAVNIFSSYIYSGS